jgi:hypothetical protein
MSNLDFALHYASLGFGVIPLHTPVNSNLCSCNNPQCKSIGKHPRTMNGLKGASKDQQQLRNWFETYFADANIGVVTGAESNLVVLDVDTIHGGATTLYELQQRYGELPQTVKAKTGGGGYHFLFQHPGFQIKNSAGRLGAGLDIRGDGGYIVAPPSLHASGQKYEWLTPEMELAELPKWLIDLLMPPQQQVASLQSPAPTRQPLTATNTQTRIPEGQRNRTLYEWACGWRGKGFSYDAILAQLKIENAERCDPPLDDRELIQIARSADKQPKGMPPAPEPHYQNAQDPEAPPPQLFQPLGAFLSQSVTQQERIVFDLARREIGLLSAVTNKGKSTLLRNVMLALAAGLEYPPLVQAGPPRRVALLDFETSASRLQNDFQTMMQSLHPDSQRIAAENLQIVCEGIVGNEVFSLSKHLHLVEQQAKNIDFLVVDTATAAFDIFNENDNSEVIRKALKPLRATAINLDCAILIIHHIGKLGTDGPNQGEGAYKGRGASSFGAFAASVFNLAADSNEAERVTLSCDKRKDGANYKHVLQLNRETRWFTLSVTVPPRAKTNYDLVVEFVNNHPDQPVRRAHIVAALKNQMTEKRIEQCLKEAAVAGDLENPKRGLYGAPTPLFPADDDTDFAKKVTYPVG